MAKAQVDGAVPSGQKGCDPFPEPVWDIDHLYNETDRIYYRFARRCGISTCAYWMMYDIERGGGRASMRKLTESWAYSKQTICSAIKSLEAKGLIELSFAEGSRKSKVAAFTEDGRVFSDRYVVPAIQAELRAFRSLDARLRTAFIEGARGFSEALHREFDLLEANDAEGAGKSA